MRKFQWGILGTGSIARQFVRGLNSVPEAEVLAVGSRSEASAAKFADKRNIPRRHASYQALASDPDVDVVYIATPHPFHAENATLCLEAGKAVLCEKPFCVNAAEAERVVGLAREKGLFLMEGMWTRFFPLMGEVRRLVSEGSLGEVRMLNVDFGFRADPDPASRLFAPGLGGGALLDVGVYCVSFASMVLGRPSGSVGISHLGETGVDEQASIGLEHEGGRLANLSIGIRTTTPQEATIMGTEGYVRIHAPWWRPESMTISRPGEEDETVEVPVTGNGFDYEAAEVMRCLEAGKTESEIMPLDETVSVMKTMDTIRAAWGLKYPGEEVTS
ncbi:MAG: Gfo/Idh/MocA family oxidoreductase [Actinomycetota bacterium]|nr:Gfo/Idh/MocA family oxidoreductase [Actinomycetota bacterium]